MAKGRCVSGSISCFLISMPVLTPRESIAIHSKVWSPVSISLNVSSPLVPAKPTHAGGSSTYRRSRISEPCSRVTARQVVEAVFGCSLLGQERVVQLPTRRRNLHAFFLLPWSLVTSPLCGHYSSFSSAVELHSSARWKHNLSRALQAHPYTCCLPSPRRTVNKPPATFQGLKASMASSDRLLWARQVRYQSLRMTLHETATLQSITSLSKS